MVHQNTTTTRVHAVSYLMLKFFFFKRTFKKVMTNPLQRNFTRMCDYKYIFKRYRKFIDKVNYYAKNLKSKQFSHNHQITQANT